MGEYVDAIEICPKCGSTLVPGSPPPTHTRTEWRELVPVASYGDVTIADLQRSLLEAAGIPATVESEHMAAIAWPYSQVAGGFRVFVPPDRVSEAERLLRTDASSDLDDLPESLTALDADSPGAHPTRSDSAESGYRDAASELLEMTGIALAICAFRIVADLMSPASDDSFALRYLAAVALRDLGWVIVLCYLLNRGTSFRWNLPASEMAWVGEILWGIGLFQVLLFVSHWFHAWAAWIGLESHPSPWDAVFENPRAAMVYRFMSPIVALYEEILFRVYTQTRLSRMLGRWSAFSVLISAGLYAAWHAHSPAQAFSTFGTGLVFGIAYQVSKKAPRLVFAHSIPLMLP